MVARGTLKPASAPRSAAQLETPDEYLQRYSDMVRESGKQELTSAINLMLPMVTGVEILTGETGES